MAPAHARAARAAPTASVLVDGVGPVTIHIDAYIGRGTSAEVYIGDNARVGQLAVKVIYKPNDFKNELAALKALVPDVRAKNRFPKLLGSQEWSSERFLCLKRGCRRFHDAAHPPLQGCKPRAGIIIMSLHGPSMETVVHPNNENHSTGSLPVADVLEFARQGLECLRVLHEKDLSHGDVKPENFVLVGDSGAKVLLLDLGCSRCVDDERTDLREGTVYGTPRYASAWSHEDYPALRVDDVRALVYTSVYLLQGTLPWAGRGLDNATVKQEKLLDAYTPAAIIKRWAIDAEKGPGGLPYAGIAVAPLLAFVEAVWALGRADTPDYEKLGTLLGPSMPSEGVTPSWCDRMREQLDPEHRLLKGKRLVALRMAARATEEPTAPAAASSSSAAAAASATASSAASYVALAASAAPAGLAAASSASASASARQASGSPPRRAPTPAASSPPPPLPAAPSTPPRRARSPPGARLPRPTPPTPRSGSRGSHVRQRSRSLVHSPAVSNPVASPSSSSSSSSRRRTPAGSPLLSSALPPPLRSSRVLATVVTPSEFGAYESELNMTSHNMKVLLYHVRRELEATRKSRADDLAKHAEALADERAKADALQAKFQEERAKARDERTSLQGKVDALQTKFQEERAKFQEERAKLQEEHAKSQTERAAERAAAEAERAVLKQQCQLHMTKAEKDEATIRKFEARDMKRRVLKKVQSQKRRDAVGRPMDTSSSSASMSTPGSTSGSNGGIASSFSTSSPDAPGPAVPGGAAGGSSSSAAPRHRPLHLRPSSLVPGAPASSDSAGSSGSSRPPLAAESSNSTNSIEIALAAQSSSGSSSSNGSNGSRRRRGAPASRRPRTGFATPERSTKSTGKFSSHKARPAAKHLMPLVFDPALPAAAAASKASRSPIPHAEGAHSSASKLTPAAPAHSGRNATVGSVGFGARRSRMGVSTVRPHAMTTRSSSRGLAPKRKRGERSSSEEETAPKRARRRRQQGPRTTRRAAVA